MQLLLKFNHFLRRAILLCTTGGLLLTHHSTIQSEAVWLELSSSLSLCHDPFLILFVLAGNVTHLVFFFYYYFTVISGPPTLSSNSIWAVFSLLFISFMISWEAEWGPSKPSLLFCQHLIAWIQLEGRQNVKCKKLNRCNYYLFDELEDDNCC